MKKIFALAAVAALTAGVSAYAANPFSDVSTDHWAYQAVADLSAQGVVEGYPNGTFGGEKHITRFEVAQIVARLLAQESQLNASQKATVEKLAAEYADELSNLGVRVNNLENKVGNITWTGDSRVKYEREVKLDPNDDSHYEITGRIRLNVTAQTSPEMAVKARLVNTFSFDGKNLDREPYGDNGIIKVDRLHVEYSPMKNTMIDLGHTDAVIGSGAWYGKGINGIVATYDNNTIGLQAGYGRLTDYGNLEQTYYIPRKNSTQGDLEVNNPFNIDTKKEMWFLQGHTMLGKYVTLGAFFTHFNKKESTKPAGEFVGINGKVQLGDALSLDGEYVGNRHLITKVTEADHKVTEADHKARFWNAGLNYRIGMAKLGLHYYDVEAGSYIGGSNLPISHGMDGQPGRRFWSASLVMPVAEDVTLEANYNFKSKAQSRIPEGTTQSIVASLPNFWNVSLNYTF